MEKAIFKRNEDLTKLCQSCSWRDFGASLDRSHAVSVNELVVKVAVDRNA